MVFLMRQNLLIKMQCMSILTTLFQIKALHEKKERCEQELKAAQEINISAVDYSRVWTKSGDRIAPQEKYLLKNEGLIMALQKIESEIKRLYREVMTNSDRLSRLEKLIMQCSYLDNTPDDTIVKLLSDEPEFMSAVYGRLYQTIKQKRDRKWERVILENLRIKAINKLKE